MQIEHITLDGDVRDGAEIAKLNELVDAVNTLFNMTAAFHKEKPTTGKILADGGRAVFTFD
jgi:hypothetical protein